jgi:hypothetical protein
MKYTVDHFFRLKWLILPIKASIALLAFKTLPGFFEKQKQAFQPAF